MFRKIRKNIERHRYSDRNIWKIIIFLKDIVWKMGLFFQLDKLKTLKGVFPFRFFFFGFPRRMMTVKDIIGVEKDAVVYTKVWPEKAISRSLPRTIEPKIHHNFCNNVQHISSEKFVLTIQNGYVVFRECFVITPKRFLVKEINDPMGMSKSAIYDKKEFPPLKHIHGRVTVLPNVDNYFHWMFETLPRILLLRALNIQPDYYVTGLDTKLKIETLEKMGIPRSKIIAANDTMYIMADELIAPSMPINRGEVRREVCDFIRDNFLVNTTSGSNDDKYEKIYVSRGDAQNGRKVLNEAAVIDFLKKRGFTIVTMDEFSVEEQARIFHAAHVIIAPHGAALTNLVFSQKGTKLIEFFNSAYVNGCFWGLSELVGINYCYFVTQSHPRALPGDNLLIDIGKLEKSLKIMKVNS